MARLPVPGSDSGIWGDLLNEYLQQSHDAGGALKAGSVTTTTIAAGAVTSAAIANGSLAASKLAAGSGTNGQALILDSAAAGGFRWGTVSGGGGTGDPTMGGDLTGTASNAQISGGAVGTAELANGAVTDAKVAAGIAQSKITNLSADLAAKASDNTVVKLTGDQTIAGVKAFSASPTAPAPTASGQVATKGYVDSAAAAASGGGLVTVYRNSNYTASNRDFVVCDNVSGTFTDLTLPAPSAGSFVRVKKIDSTPNGVVVKSADGSNIDGSLAVAVNNPWESYDFFSSATQWYLV